MIRNDVEYIRV